MIETSMGIQLRDRSEAAEYQHAVHRFYLEVSHEIDVI